MKMKKIVSLLLAASMAFGLAACGTSGEDSDSGKGESSVLKVAAVETNFTDRICGKKYAPHLKRQIRVLQLN